jgi:methionyl-tRNA formyltransferase
VRTLFIGSTKHGFLVLRELLDVGADIVGVVSLEQHAHETERYEEAIRALAASRSIPLFETKAMKERDYRALIHDEIRPDLGIVAGCRILLPRAIWEPFPMGCLAIHDSLLPAYRGFAPLNWAVLNGEARTGATLFYVSDRMDGGDIIAQRSVVIGPDDTVTHVQERLNTAIGDMIREAYPSLVAGRIARTPQDYYAGTFTCSRRPEDGWIDWTQSASTIHNQIRALAAPYPGALTAYEGVFYRVWTGNKVRNPRQYAGRIPGRIIDIDLAEGTVDVLAGDGVVRLFQVQREGAPVQPAAEVFRSIRGTLGIPTPDLLKRIHLLETEVADLKDSVREMIAQLSAQRGRPYSPVTEP